MDPYERLLSEVITTSDDCWEVQRMRNNAGYSRVQIGGGGGSYVQGHRLSYERNVGPIPDGMVVDHVCRNRTCINPDHLQLLTMPQNSGRNAWSLKTHCPQGHPYDEQNTYWYPGEGRHRQCRACGREKSRLRRAMK